MKFEAYARNKRHLASTSLNWISDAVDCCGHEHRICVLCRCPSYLWEVEKVCNSQNKQPLLSPDLAWTVSSLLPHFIVASSLL